jgi:hypothetical protein
MRRPIASDIGSESSPAAEFIDHFLNPISQKQASYIKHTYNFIDTLCTIPVPAHTYIFTIDTDSLYTKIYSTSLQGWQQWEPHSEDIQIDGEQANTFYSYLNWGSEIITLQLTTNTIYRSIGEQWAKSLLQPTPTYTWQTGRPQLWTNVH